MESSSARGPGSRRRRVACSTLRCLRRRKLGAEWERAPQGGGQLRTVATGAVGAVVVALGHVARLVALAVVQPRPVAPGHAAVKGKDACAAARRRHSSAVYEAHMGGEAVAPWES